MLIGSTVDGIEAFSKSLKEGTLTVPPPSEKIADWPVIGKPLNDFWKLASVNIGAALKALEPYLKAFGLRVFSAGAEVGFTFIKSIISIIIAGVFLINARSGKRVFLAIFTRLAGEQGEEFTNLSEATVRSVVQGVLGVALIQAALAGIGLVSVDVPAAAAPRTWCGNPCVGHSDRSRRRDDGIRHHRPFRGAGPVCDWL